MQGAKYVSNPEFKPHLTPFNPFVMVMILLFPGLPDALPRRESAIVTKLSKGNGAEKHIHLRARIEREGCQAPERRGERANRAYRYVWMVLLPRVAGLPRTALPRHCVDPSRGPSPSHCTPSPLAGSNVRHSKEILSAK